MAGAAWLHARYRLVVFAASAMRCCLRAALRAISRRMPRISNLSETMTHGIPPPLTGGEHGVAIRC